MRPRPRPARVPRPGRHHIVAAVLAATALTVTATTTASATPAPVAEWRLCMFLGGHPSVQKGSGGEAVRHLQCILNEVYRFQNVTVNGVFEEVTEASVKTLQRQFGLTGTGVVDAATWTALHP